MRVAKALSGIVIASAALTLAGCTTSPDSDSPSASTPSAPASPSLSPEEINADLLDQMETVAGLLSDGRTTPDGEFPAAGSAELNEIIAGYDHAKNSDIFVGYLNKSGKPVKKNPAQVLLCGQSLETGDIIVMDVTKDNRLLTSGAISPEQGDKVGSCRTSVLVLNQSTPWTVSMTAFAFMGEEPASDDASSSADVTEPSSGPSESPTGE